MKCTRSISAVYQITAVSSKSIFIWKNDWYTNSTNEGIWQTVSRKWTKWDCHFKENTWPNWLIFGHDVQHAESQFPNQGSNPGPQHWKLRVLTTGPPGKSQHLTCFIANAKIQAFGRTLEFWKMPWADSFWRLKGSSDETGGNRNKSSKTKYISIWKTEITEQTTVDQLPMHNAAKSNTGKRSSYRARKTSGSNTAEKKHLWPNGGRTLPVTITTWPFAGFQCRIK